MKNYKVRISTSGMLEMSIRARSENDALKKAISQWLGMDAKTLDSTLYVKFSVDGHDVDEVQRGIIHKTVNSKEDPDVKTSVIDME